MVQNLFHYLGVRGKNIFSGDCDRAIGLFEKELYEVSRFFLKNICSPLAM